MKKIILITAIVILLLTACGGSPSSSAPNDSPSAMGATDSKDATSTPEKPNINELKSDTLEIANGSIFLVKYDDGSYGAVLDFNGENMADEYLFYVYICGVFYTKDKNALVAGQTKENGENVSFAWSRINGTAGAIKNPPIDYFSESGEYSDSLDTDFAALVALLDQY